MSDSDSPVATGAGRFRPGAVLVTATRTVSVADIDSFAHLTGDENPLHLDEEFARRGLFRGRVAHGLLTLSLTLGLWYRAGLFEGETVVFHGIDKLRFLRPVRPGNTLSAKLTIVQSTPSPRGDVVELENTTFNERDEAVLTFTARLLLSRATTRDTI